VTQITEVRSPDGQDGGKLSPVGRAAAGKTVNDQPRNLSMSDHRHHARHHDETRQNEFADTWSRGHHDNDQGRHDRHDRQEGRHDRHEDRHDRHESRHDWKEGRHDQHEGRQDWNDGRQERHQSDGDGRACEHGFSANHDGGTEQVWDLSSFEAMLNGPSANGHYGPIYIDYDVYNTYNQNTSNVNLNAQNGGSIAVGGSVSAQAAQMTQMEPAPIMPDLMT
jgi:hypothetical protein